MNNFRSMGCTVVLLAMAIAAISGCQQQDPASSASSSPRAPPPPEPAVREAQPIDSALTADAGPAVANESPEAEIDAAIDQVLGDHAAYRQVMNGFKQAIAAGDAKSAAMFVRFPIGVDIKGHNVVLNDANAFEKRYGEFITPAISKAITETNYADVMVNSQGVMLGQGEAWISGICNDNECKDVDVKVVTIQPGPG